MACRIDGHLNISRNPLWCDKRMCWMLTGLHLLELTVSKYPCTGPDEMRDIPWKDLQPDVFACGKKSCGWVNWVRTDFRFHSVRILPWGIN